MITVEIRGVRNGTTFLEVQQIAGLANIYRKGTDEALFVDYTSRERADLDVVHLNNLHGVQARILELTDAGCTR